MERFFARRQHPVGVTIRDIAALANTSTATVSRVLSNKPGVEDAKRQRILALVEKLGYSPNRIARNLALQKSHVLGFIAADLVSKEYVDFFRHLQHKVESMGYQVLIADSEQNIEKEKYNIEVMRQHRAEGIIVFPVHDWKLETDIDHFLQLRLQRYPFVVVGKLEGLSCDTVMAEETTAARKMAQHLVDLGHRRIAFVGVEDENRPVRERLDAVRTTLHKAGCDLDAHHIIAHHPGWIDEMCEVLAAEDRPTALIFMNDVLALMAYRSLLETGLKMPEALSIAAFGNDIWTRNLKPTITGTTTRIDEIARFAMELLFKRIEDPDRPPVHRQVGQEVLLRESTAPPLVRA
jgi:DNA-binding LacI/PurR family transcriptional regulator